jgi:hypothetical protein
MEHVRQYCDDMRKDSPHEAVHPQRAVMHALSAMPNLLGSATATVATLGETDSALRIYSIGDSGLSVWRWDSEGDLVPFPPYVMAAGARGSRGHTAVPLQDSSGGAWALRFQTRSQQSTFNAPLQLAKDPRYSNKIGEGSRTALPMQPGDLVLLATDGLLDNLWMADVQVGDARACANI